MKKKMLLVPLAALLLSAMAAPALAQYSWTVGVQVGDWFLYKPELLVWDTEGVSFPPWWAPQLQAYNETEWINYTVTDTSVQDFVNFTVVTHLLNGTTTTVDMAENITGSFTMMVIGANLTAGTEIRPPSQYFGAYILNASRMRTYNNSITREANVLNITGYGIDTEYCWDKETGIQVVYYTGGVDVYDYITSSTATYWAKVELQDSSIDELDIIPDLTGLILLLTSMAITIPIVILHRRKKIIHLK
jgi:hypothetical protein